MEENSKIQGHMSYTLYDENGSIKAQGNSKNTITTFMNTIVAHQMAAAAGGSAISFMGVGSGTGQTAASTDLAKYINLCTLSGTLQTGSNVVYSAYWAAGSGTGSIYEAGLYQVSGTTRNTLCTYNDAIRVNKGDSDTLKIDWTVTYG
jgi:hypothetical protein